MLRGAILRGTSLRQADLSKADLSETDFTGAKIDENQARQAGLDGKKLDKVTTGAIKQVEPT